MIEELVAVISNAGVVDGRVAPNIEVLEEEGFLVVQRIKLELGRDKAMVVAPQEPEQTDFVGVCVALLLKRDAAFETFERIRPDLDNVYASMDPWTTLRDKTMFFPEPEASKNLERTLMIIKPNYLQEDSDTIMAELDANGFVVIDKLRRIMSQEVALQLFHNSQEDAAYVSNDVSVAMVLERVGAVDAWRLLMGPEDPVLAKEIAPNTLRAKLGEDTVHNVIFGSESVERAQTDIARLFPAPFNLERTLAILKPDILQSGKKDEIMELIAQNGFTILASETIYLSKPRAELVYEEHKNRSFFDQITTYMSNGPSLVMVLGKPGALDAWKKLIGPPDVAKARVDRPASLRARFGTNIIRNGFHGSDNMTEAKREIDLFFESLPVEKIPALLEVEDMLNKKPAPRPHVQLTKSLNDVLVEGLTELCRVKPVGMDAVSWLAQWLLRNNPNKPNVGLVEEQVEEESVLTKISKEHDGKKPEVVWVVGGPGSDRTKHCATIVNEMGYEYLSIDDLCASAQRQGTEYGELISECKRLKRPIPTHVPVNLVQTAMMNSTGRRKFVVNGFPANLDMAFAFEKTICECQFVLYFDVGEDKALASGLDPQVTMAALQRFKLDVLPIVEHYQVFNKLKTINAEAPDQKQINNKIRAAFG